MRYDGIEVGDKVVVTPMPSSHARVWRLRGRQGTVLSRDDTGILVFLGKDATFKAERAEVAKCL